MTSQILINIISQSSIYLLLAFSFTFIYRTLKYFYFTHAFTITLFPYLLLSFSRLGFSSTEIVLALLTSFIIYLVLFSSFILLIKKKGITNWASSLSSLGLYIIMQNILSIIYGDEQILLPYLPSQITLFNGSISIIQIIIIILSLTIYLFLSLFINKSNLGLKIKSFSENEILCNIYGIKTKHLIIWSFSIGTFLAVIAGILIGLDTSITPNMGFNFLLFGVIAMIIGGIGSTWGLLGGSLILATAQQLGAYYIDGKWMDAIAYIILILFLIWKPLGFSGRRLKKTEI